jgi:hypothetical protein
MFRLIKWLLFLAIIGIVFLAVTGEKIRGKTIEEHLAPYLGSKEFKEGVHDVRAIVGQGLKAAGEAISEDVTEDEKKQLDGLVKQELEQGAPVQMAPGQTALAPTAQAQAVPAKKAIQRPTTQQMEALPKPAAPAPTTLPATTMTAPPRTAVPPVPPTTAPAAAPPQGF